MPAGDDKMMKQYIIEQLGAIEDDIEKLKADSASTEAIVDKHTVEISKQKETLKKITEVMDEISKELSPNADPTHRDPALQEDATEIETPIINSRR
jgi:chromosome segregation ATPase